MRAWCDLVERLAALHFRRCSIAFTSQVAMVPLVPAGGTVRSFEAPYECDACGVDDARLLEVGAIAHDGDRLTRRSSPARVAADRATSTICPIAISHF